VAEAERQELADLVKKFYGANDTVHLFGARRMRAGGEGLLPSSPQTATRAPSTTSALPETALGWSIHARHPRVPRARYPARKLPPFEVNVALHTGPVALAVLGPTAWRAGADPAVGMP
jgi:hypothetical protein